MDELYGKKRANEILTHTNVIFLLTRTFLPDIIMLVGKSVD